MSQSNSSSSSSAQNLLDALIISRHLIRTASSATNVSLAGVGRGSSRNYVLSFAVLVLVTSIVFFSTVMESSASSASTLRTVYANKRVGEHFELGHYPQGDNGEIKPITWRVLQRNEYYLLVIAEQCLDCKPYNKKWCDITWADCTLRRWLNTEFYNKAFNEQERKCILKTRIINNAGPSTADYIFLLSVDEAKRLFANKDAHLANPTKFAVKNGSLTYCNYCTWWLRSRGEDVYRAAYVRTDGYVYDDGDLVDFVDCAVRPALKLAL